MQYSAGTVLGLRGNALRKEDNVPIHLKLQAAGVGGEKINKETNKISRW